MFQDIFCHQATCHKIPSEQKSHYSAGGEGYSSPKWACELSHVEMGTSRTSGPLKAP